MAGWMINCKEYAAMLSQGLDQPMSFWEKVSMKLHQILCPPCKHIQRQFDAIRSACRYAPEGDEPMDGKGNRLSEEVCEQMKAVLRNSVKEKDL